MHDKNAFLRTNIHKTLVLQAFIVVITAVVFALVAGQQSAFSAAYGGGCALVLGLLLGFSVYKLAQGQESSTAQSSALLALGVVPRLLLTAALFWFGLWQLKLAPEPMIVGFILAYLGYLITFYKLKQQ